MSDDRWVGTRDRSWGIRPVGEPEPPGRAASEPDDGFGFWWTYVPLRFDDFAVVVIAQEDGDGTRTLNEAVRVFPAASGRPPEQLGWPEVEVRYRPGTRHPESAVLHMRTPRRQVARPRDRDPRVRGPQLRARATAGTPTGRTGSGGDGAGPRAWSSTCATPPSPAASPSGWSTTWPGPPVTGPRDGACSSTAPSAATSRRVSPVGSRWPRGVSTVTDPADGTAGAEVEATTRPQTSTRDRHELHRRLVRWLATRVRRPRGVRARGARVQRHVERDAAVRVHLA